MKDTKKLDELNRIVVALDFDDIDQARKLVEQLDPKLCRLRIGKEMFTLFGPDWVTEVVNKGFDVFLDLKFHDIPNTVANACLAAAELGVWMINVHVAGGMAMMCAAREAIDSTVGRKPVLTGVTVLTSLSDQDLITLGMTKAVPEQVAYYAQMAASAGLDGVVCSPLEIQQLREAHGEDFTLITPGVRLDKNYSNDQKRVMTPNEALKAGANYIVIGRAITASSDPLAALSKIEKSI